MAASPTAALARMYPPRPVNARARPRPRHVLHTDQARATIPRTTNGANCSSYWIPTCRASTAHSITEKALQSTISHVTGLATVLVIQPTANPIVATIHAAQPYHPANPRIIWSVGRSQEAKRLLKSVVKRR